MGVGKLEEMAINLLWVGPGWCKLEAAHALGYHWLLSSLPLFDISHGCHVNVENALNAVGLKEFWYLFVVSCNVLFGRPDDERSRWMQLRAAMGDCFTRRNEVLCEHRPLTRPSEDKVTCYVRLAHEYFGA